MIAWIYQNANHIAPLFGGFLGILSVITVSIDQRRKKAGLGGISKGPRVAVMFILALALVFAGILLVRLNNG